jgi:Icc-related predicted phosphoesterase
MAMARPARDASPVGDTGGVRPWLLIVTITVLGAAAGVASLFLAPATTADLGPGTVSLRARCCGGGDTELLLPPVGSISAATHRPSLTFVGRIEAVDVRGVQELTNQRRPDERLLEQVRADLPGLLRTFAIRTAVIAAVAGALAGVLLPGRRWWFAPLGAAGALVAVGALLDIAWRSYDPEAFAQPSFTGPVAEAPAVIEAASRYVEGFEDVRGRIDVIGAQIGELYATSITESLEPDPDETRLLHVSDIHLNPLGIELAADLADRFDVEAIIDTGDITSFGSPVEARVGDLLRDLPRPYVLVPGNHDSPANRRALAAIEGMDVLDGDTVDLGDLRVLGVADPTFTATNEIDDDQADAEIDAAAPEVAARVDEDRPDVLAVHTPRQAEEALGSVPLVIAGHLHERTRREAEGTLVLTVGSTGATGLGSFTVETDIPYEAEVLRFVDGDLIGIDYVTLSGTDGEFTIDRSLIEPT